MLFPSPLSRTPLSIIPSLCYTFIMRSTAQTVDLATDVETLAFALRKGMLPAVFGQDAGWGAKRLQRAVRSLSQKIQREYGVLPPAAVFDAFVSKVNEQIQDLNRIKRMFEDGLPHATTQTVTEVVQGTDGKPQRATVVHTTPARNGVTSADVIRACDLLIQSSRSIIEVGQTLGVIVEHRKDEAPRTLHVHQTLIQAVRAGDWSTVKAIRDGYALPALSPQVSGWSNDPKGSGLAPLSRRRRVPPRSVSA